MNPTVEVLVSRSAEKLLLDLDIDCRYGVMTNANWLVVNIKRDDAPSLIELMEEYGNTARYSS
jgi:hypothetical protein